LEPALAPTVRLAFHAPDEHAIDPRRLARALAAGCAQAGIELRERAEVAELLVEAGAVRGVRLAGPDGGEVLAAEAVVVAAGAWSATLPGLPDEARVPVRPVKGQLLRLRDPDGPDLLTRNLRFDAGPRSGYIVPRGDGRYVLGATVEERAFDTSVTAGAIHDLVRDAAEVLPGVLELELEEALAGLRPGTPDNAPLIGAGRLEGLVWATGHYRNGILLAPLTADAIVSVLAGDGLPEEALAADPARFSPVHAV
jgi:glycine oxidase